LIVGTSATLGAYSTTASSVPTLTVAESTPGVSCRAFSILMTHDAHVIPSILNRARATSDR
jgi:hypothetical protein